MTDEQQDREAFRITSSSPADLDCDLDGHLPVSYPYPLAGVCRCGRYVWTAKEAGTVEHPIVQPKP